MEFEVGDWEKFSYHNILFDFVMIHVCVHLYASRKNKKSGNTTVLLDLKIMKNIFVHLIPLMVLLKGNCILLTIESRCLKLRYNIVRSNHFH